MFQVSPSATIPSVVSEDALERLSAIARQGGAGLEAFYQSNKDDIRKLATMALRARGLMALVVVLCDAAAKQHNKDRASTATRRAITARFALDLPETVRQMHLPQSILHFYPAKIEGLLDSLQMDSGELDWDREARDFAHALGLLWPAGAQDIEKNRTRGPKPFLAMALRQRLPWLPAFYLRHHMWLPCLESHTDSRDTSSFTPAGWDATYECLADLLALWPQVPAFVATSWFYDPEIRSISPRLAYLQDVPLANGAIRLLAGSSDLDIRRATLTSGTRRRLYEEGRYLPTSYTIIWPREDLMRWRSARARVHEA